MPCVPPAEGDGVAATGLGEGEEDWLAVAAAPQEEEGEVPDMREEGGGREEDEDEEVPDMEGFEEENLAEEVDPSAVQPTLTLGTRSYDLALTYDAYYQVPPPAPPRPPSYPLQTPKVWLVGYAASGQPLSGADMLRDVSPDHAQKTVTLAEHPALGKAGGSWLWIHPCRHAQVMHKFIARIAAQGRAPRVDQYLLLFLKFLGAVLPTIQYDNTMEIDLA